MGKRSDRRLLRIGFGEYDPPGGDTAGVAARSLVLKLIAEIEPEVLGSLCDDLLDAYARLAEKHRLLTEGQHMFTWALKEAEADEAVAEFPGLRAWARRWHLDVFWVRVIALLTLYELYKQEQDPSEERPPRLRCTDWEYEATSFAPPLTAEDLAHDCVLPTWDPTGYLAEEGERAIREAFERYLPQYMARIHRLARERGATPVRVKRKPEHLEWFVRYQVQGISYEILAAEQVARRASETASMRKPRKRDQTDFTPDAIYRGVRSVSQLVELPLRDHREGIQ